MIKDQHKRIFWTVSLIGKKPGISPGTRSLNSQTGFDRALWHRLKASEFRDLGGCDKFAREVWANNVKVSSNDNLIISTILINSGHELYYQIYDQYYYYLMNSHDICLMQIMAGVVDPSGAPTWGLTTTFSSIHLRYFSLAWMGCHSQSKPPNSTSTCSWREHEQKCVEHLGVSNVLVSHLVAQTISFCPSLTHATTQTPNESLVAPSVFKTMVNSLSDSAFSLATCAHAANFTSTMDLAKPWATSMLVPLTKAKAMACLWELWSSWFRQAILWVKIWVIPCKIQEDSKLNMLTFNVFDVERLTNSSIWRLKNSKFQHIPTVNSKFNLELAKIEQN